MEFFDPTTVRDSVHVIGVGAIGSIVVEQLVRLGFEHIHIYDFDTVTDYNVTNQLYRTIDIGEKKTTALITINHLFKILIIFGHQKQKPAFIFFHRTK